MAQDVPFRCNCGAVRGTLRDISKRSGGHVRCHCQDCRAAAIWVGEADTDPGGIHYYQTTPDKIEFTQGLSSLRAFKWKSPRLVRWYAPCCGVVMFNTLDTPQWAFASMNTARFSDPTVLGNAKAYAFKPMPNAKPKTSGFRHFMLGFARRTFWARVSGGWRKTPFFGVDGAAIAPIQVLTRDDRSSVQIAPPTLVS